MKKSKYSQRWAIGDLFAIPLVDEKNLLGQIIAAESEVLNSVSCALYDQRFDGQSAQTPQYDRLFSIIMTTRDLLDSGVWKVISHAAVNLARERFPFESLRCSGFVGAKVIGSKNITEFANAYYGLVPWDDWADPLYLDRLLISPDKKPLNLRYKNSINGASS